MKNLDEITTGISEVIQFMINHEENQPKTEFCANVDKLINLKAELVSGDEQRSSNCNIPLVSGSVFTIKDMKKAYNAGVSRGVDNINKPTVDWTLNWHRNMFDRWFKEHYA